MGSFFSVLVICHILPHISAHVYHFLLEDVLMEGGNPLWIYGHQGPPLVSNDIHWICLAGQNPCFFPMDIYHHIPLNEFKWYKVRSHKNSHTFPWNSTLSYLHLFTHTFFPRDFYPKNGARPTTLCRMAWVFHQWKPRKAGLNRRFPGDLMGYLPSGKLTWLWKP